MMAVLLALLLLAPLATALACRLLAAPGVRDAAHALGCAVTWGAGLLLAGAVFAGNSAPDLGDVLLVDSLSAYMVALVVTVAGAAGLYAPGYLRHEVSHGGLAANRIASFYLWFHLFVWTMLLLVVMNNLGLLWAAIEATTVVSAILVGFYQTRPALEAAWKYLMLCSVGIIIALFGVLLTYYGASQLPGESSLAWTDLMRVAPQLDARFMRLALVFVVIGFGTKAGLAPLHAWLPDAYSQAPAPVSALLSGGLSTCALYGILRFAALASPSVGPDLVRMLLIGFGLVSVAVAVPFLLVQRDIKRLLAYSSVEHAGVAVLAFGIGGPAGLYAGLLHLLNHALVKTLLFLVAGRLVQQFGTGRIARIRGLLTVAPITGPLFLAGALAIAGVPPMSIFVSEFGMAAAGAEQALWLPVALAMTLLALAFVAIVYQAARMAFGPAEQAPAHPPSPLPRLQRVALAVPLAGMLVFGVAVPAPVSQALGQAVALLLPSGGR